MFRFFQAGRFVYHLTHHLDILNDLLWVATSNWNLLQWFKWQNKYQTSRSICNLSMQIIQN